MARKWLKDCTTVEAIQDQVLNTLPKDMGIFVRDRKPKSSLKVSMLADDYLQARIGIPTGLQTPLKRKPIKVLCIWETWTVNKIQTNYLVPIGTQRSQKETSKV